MVDRIVAYTGQIPLDTMILQPQRNTFVGIGALAQATIGPQNASPAFAVDGLVCTASSPASLVLNIGPGSLYAQGVVDQSSYGSLPADLANATILQGIALAVTPLTFTPPGTGGFATNYLVQVAMNVQDTTPVVLPYVNATQIAAGLMPTSPWQGPNNSGVSQNTVRQCAISIQAKAGVAASAGTQVTPSPDPGYTGLYSVTVANGATTLTSSNFSIIAGAPFIPSTLMAMPQSVQSARWTFATDTGTANAMVAALSPAPASLIKGLQFTVQKSGNANTGAVTLNLNGSGVVACAGLSGAAFTGGELPASAMITLSYDGTKYQVQTVSPAQSGGPLYDGTATGTNTYTVSNLTPTAAALTNRMLIKASFAAPNTSSSTLNIGFGANAITYPNGTALSGGEITDHHLLSYNLSRGSWDLLTPTSTLSIPAVLVHSGADTSGTTNSIIVTMAPSITSYASGNVYVVTSVALTNTSGVTANFNGIGTRVVARDDGTALRAGDIKQNQSVVLVDNGSQLQVANFQPSGMNTQVFNSSGTYTPTPGCRQAIIYATGGGGSGGLSTAGSGGGGSGATAIALASLVGLAAQTVTIGAGGAGVTSNGATGNTGGTTSVGALVTAAGGIGGTTGTTGHGEGGVGGTASVGNLALIPGSAGTCGITSGGSSVICGNGGPSFWGAIPIGAVNTTSGDVVGPSGAPGSQGSGGSGGRTTASGAGGTGYIMIIEF